MAVDLFGNGEAMARMAVLSDDGRFRYRLQRDWRAELGRVVWIMLNPSTADAERDDPTLRRCIAFTRAWGYGALTVVNLYPLRSPHPRDLRTWLREGGGFEVVRNLEHHVVPAARGGDLVIAAWGAAGGNLSWPRLAGETLTARGIALHHLGLTAGGYPKHPLARGHHRIPDDQQPQPWSL